jgi:hypothetical protein
VVVVCVSATHNQPRVDGEQAGWEKSKCRRLRLKTCFMPYSCPWWLASFVVVEAESQLSRLSLCALHWLFQESSAIAAPSSPLADVSGIQDQC